MGKNLENLVELAVDGDRKALETLVKEIQDMVYNLALRMLWHPEDAKDASQEILIKVVTNLGKFQHKSTFKTWVYRVAANHCINYNNKVFRQKLTFEAHAAELERSQSDSIRASSNAAEQKLLVEEAKVGCSNAMLQCLSPEHRMAYILGAILQVNSQEGAEIMGLSSANYRQKLSRSKRALHQFLNEQCGLVNSKNSCRCHKRVDRAVEQGRIKPEKLLFTRNKKTETLIELIDDMEDSAHLYRSNALYVASDALMTNLQKVLNLGD